LKWSVLEERVDNSYGRMPAQCSSKIIKGPNNAAAPAGSPLADPSKARRTRVLSWWESELDRSPVSGIVDDDKDLPAGSVSAVVIWSEKEKKKSVAMDVGGVAVVNHS
jgi:hypothetical protein